MTSPYITITERHWQKAVEALPFGQRPQLLIANKALEIALAEANAKPEPVDPHAALRAEYIRQRDAVPCELGFYLWEFKGETDTDKPTDWTHELPEFHETLQYRCTDISCYVSKDGEPAIRMLRTDAQKLQAETKETHIWGLSGIGDGFIGDYDFTEQGTYTYRTKQPAWTGSRDDVMALLKELELLK